MTEASTPTRPKGPADALKSPSPSIKPVTLSPSQSPSSGGNLTGVPRKLKDGAADWHNHSSEWKKLEARGESAIKKIFDLNFNSKDTTLESPQEDDVEAGSGSPGRSCRLQLEEHTDSLLDIHAKMTKIVGKFQQITKHLKGINEMACYRNKSPSAEPLFKTWQINEFYEASEKLLSMYTKELALKLTIVQNIAHTTDRDVAMTMVYAWIHEPYIDEQSDLILESLVQETGHR